MTDTTTAAEEQILVPLSKATQSTLTPPRIRESDHLLLSLNKDGTRFIAKLKCFDRPPGWTGDDNEYVEHTYPGVSNGAREIINRIPERKWLGKTDFSARYNWELGATDYTALIIKHCWPANQIHFSAGLASEGVILRSRPVFLMPHRQQAQDLYEILIKRFMVQEGRSHIIADWKLNKKLPKCPENWLENKELPLADHQRIASSLLDYGSLALFMDRGTGKTPSVIQTICHNARKLRLTENRMLLALIIVPPQVRLNWQTEFGRFASIPGKVTIIKGSQLKRLKQLCHGVTAKDNLAFGAVIVSYDSLPGSIDAFKRVPWDIIACDESHQFKSSKTKRFKTVIQLRENSKKRLILTGTPIGNKPFDLWSQLEFLYEGASGFSSYSAFRKFFGKWASVPGAGHGVEKLVALENVPLLQERLARLSLQVSKKEAGLKLPPKVYDIYEVQMTSYQKDVYIKVSESLRLEIEDRLASDQTNQLTVENILTRLLRLAQITSGHVVWDPRVDPDTGETITERRVEHICAPNPKVEAVISMLQDEERDPLGKTIIWCHWVPDIEILHKKLTEAGIKHLQYYGAVKQNDRDAIVDEFNNNPEMRVIVCNPQTAAEGLNLVGYDYNTEGGPKQDTYTDHEIFFSQNWSMILRQQAEDRAHRRGTRGTVRITDLVVPGTIDEDIRVRVMQKKLMADTVLDVREILNSVLNKENIDE